MRSPVKMAWIGVAVALSAAAWACTPVAPEAERAADPVPTLEATPEWAPESQPRLYLVDRTETSLTVVWGEWYRTTHYDVQRRDSEGGEYAIVATSVATLGLVDEGLQPDSLYYYKVRACNHLGCSKFGNWVAGVTESDADVDVPSVPNVEVFKREDVPIFPDTDKLTWTAVEGATYYQVYRDGDRLTTVNAPLTISSHTDHRRWFDQYCCSHYQVRACNKAGCSPLSQ